MKKLLIALSIVLSLAACQKEASLEVPGGSGAGGGGNNASGRLTRMVLVGGNDSLAYDFSYGASGRLSMINAVTTNYLEIIRFERNTAGIITNIIMKNPALVAIGIDSVATRYNYDAAQGRYTAGIFQVLLQGVPYIDSTAFVYDAGGKLVSRVSYGGGVNVPFQPSSKLDYTYAGANLNSVKSYSSSGSGWDLDYTTNYAFDSKTNPLVMGNESLLVDPYVSPTFGLNSTIYYGANNATVIDYIDPADPAENYKITTTYTYNSGNKPSGATSVETPGNSNSAWRFYYN